MIESELIPPSTKRETMSRACQSEHGISLASNDWFLSGRRTQDRAMELYPRLLLELVEEKLFPNCCSVCLELTINLTLCKNLVITV